MIQATNRGARITLLLALAGALPSCAALGGHADDKNPTLITRDGPRAAVTVADGAFAYSGGRSAGGSLKVNGPHGEDVYNWNYSAAGWTWDEGKATELEAYFLEALFQTGAFRVIDRATITDKQSDEQFTEAGYQESPGQDRLLVRPDLKLECSVTKMEPDAGGSSQSVRGGSWVGRFFGSLFGGGNQSSKRGECQIKIRIVDRSTGELVATATGEGFSTGTSSSAHGSGWQSGLFGSVSSSSRDDVDMSAAIQRATVRAVNEVVDQIPALYFTHPAVGAE